MNQCEYELESFYDPIEAKTKYYLKLYFNRHLVIQIETSETAYKDILEEEKKWDTIYSQDLSQRRKQ